MSEKYIPKKGDILVLGINYEKRNNIKINEEEIFIQVETGKISSVEDIEGTPNSELKFKYGNIKAKSVTILNPEKHILTLDKFKEILSKLLLH